MNQKNYYITVLKCIIALGTVLTMTACGQKTDISPLTQQNSVTQLPKEEAPLLQKLKKTDKALANRSAFYPLPQPTDAFAARLFLIDNATTSLNVQYYIYEDDTIGKVFASHLLMAAQRGVKIRILIDDMVTSGKDEAWETLALHPNIELRLFNPNRLRTLFRNMALLLDVNRLGRRMHNKALIADGSAAIIGGRNIGDVYFASGTETLFIDYDILTIGNIMPEINKEFDVYWNSEEAVPSKKIFAYNDPKSRFEIQEELQKTVDTFRQSPIGKAIHNSDFSQKIKQNNLQLTVAKQTNFYYDHPTKVSTNENDRSTHISSQISQDLKHVNDDLLIISPYFIPSDKMMERFRTLREKGVKITVITNSLASTDVFLVYSGYKDSIQELVEMGVDLYEVKPHSFKKFLRTKEWINKQSLSLHTKMMILDRDRLGIGSANIDPRSDKLNTEIFMLISSKRLASDQRERLNKVLNMENLYKLSWGEHPRDFVEDEKEYGPIWHSIEDGKEEVYYAPPHTGFWKKLGTDLAGVLPIKGYL